MSEAQTLDAGRRSTRAEGLKRAIADHITYTLARDRASATDRDVYISAAWTLRDRLAERWANTQARYQPRTPSASTTCRSSS
jgi:starch phosphorylase